MRLRKTINKIKPCVSLLLIAAMVSVSTPVFYSQKSNEHATAAVTEYQACPLNEEDGRILIHLYDTIAHPGKRIRSDKTSNDGFYGPLPASILAGNYNVTLVSYDNHSEKDSQIQPNEQWYMELYNNSSSLIVATNAIGDLPDNEDWKTEVVNYDLYVSEDASSFSVFHSKYSDIPTKGEPNSIDPICAAFDKIIVPECILNISKQADKTNAQPGDLLTYTLNFSNSGTTDCTGSGVLIQDVVDDNLEFISESHSSEVLTFGYDDSPLYFLDYDPANRTLSWNADVIAPGESGWISWTGRVADPEDCGAYDIFNTAKIASHEYSPFFDDGIFVWEYSDTVEVSLVKECANPAINVTKSANPTSLPVGGGNVDYSYAITNAGDVALTNIILSDDKCSPVNYVNGDTNANDQLETTETWSYACSTNLSATTTNVATVTGDYNAQTVQDTDEATVTVSPPQTCVSGCGGGGSLSPAIRLIKTPNPYQLPKEGGSVLYTYLVSNPGYYAITDVILTDDKCSELKFVDGDKNTNNKLDRNEIWKYTCQTNLTETTTNTATVNGKSSAGSVKDTAQATVYVPKIDLAIKLEKTANPESLSEKGGLVTYSYKVTNKGTKAISDVTLADNKCDPVNFISGDLNNDKKLDTTETWLYTCQANITKTTTNIGTVRGQVDGKYATDISEATVRVEKVLGTSIIPKGMPKTGFGGNENMFINDLIRQTLSAILILLAIANIKPLFKKRYN